MSLMKLKKNFIQLAKIQNAQILSHDTLAARESDVLVCDRKLANIVYYVKYPHFWHENAKLRPRFLHLKFDLLYMSIKK